MAGYDSKRLGLFMQNTDRCRRQTSLASTNVRACLDIKNMFFVDNSLSGAADTCQKRRLKRMLEALILIVPRFAPVNPSAGHAG